MCSNNPCNPMGSICRVQGNTFQCICFAGFVGPTCDQIDFCSNAPCFNGGTCTNLESNSSCECLPRYTGMQCEIGECAKWQDNSKNILNRFVSSGRLNDTLYDLSLVIPKHFQSIGDYANLATLGHKALQTEGNIILAPMSNTNLSTK